MSIEFTDAGTTAALKDPSRVAVQLLLNELRGSAFVWPLARDISNQVFDGSLTVIIPRAKGYNVGVAPGAPTGTTAEIANPFTNEVSNVQRTFKRDSLTIDRFRQVSDYIYDLDQDNSRIDLRANFLAEAPASLAEYLEADITISLYVGKSTAKTTGFADGDFGDETVNNYMAFTGSEGATANAVVEVSQLDDIAIAMSQVKIPKADRIFLASPKQARLLAANSSIRDASQYGTNEAILNGEVARIAGFRIVESPFLAPNRAVAFHRDAIYRAILEDAAVESSRLHRILADLLTITIKYGFQAVRDGGLIFPLGDVVPAGGASPTKAQKLAALISVADAGILANETSNPPGNTGDADNSLGSPIS